LHFIPIEISKFADEFHADDFCKVGWVGSYIMKKRLLTLHLDVLKLRNFQIVVRDVATVDAHGYVISLYAGYAIGVVRIGLSYRRGLLRCSFNYDGQCEGLRTWDE
jgi:hypothetical protein